jgi:hypothetical protein
MMYDGRKLVSPEGNAVVRVWDESSGPGTGSYRWLCEDQEGVLWLHDFDEDPSTMRCVDDMDWCNDLAKLTPAWCLDENAKTDDVGGYDGLTGKCIVIIRDAIKKHKVCK